MQIMWKDGFHKKLKVSIVAPFSEKLFSKKVAKSLKTTHIVENISGFFGTQLCQEWVILSS